MSEQLTQNYLIDVVNGRTTSKEQERQFVSTGGKLSEVKTWSQVLADAIIEERTHQYKRRHGCFWTLCQGQNLHALSVNLRLANRGKLRRQNLWVLI